LVIRYDMYEREPWFMALLAAGLGYAAMSACGLVEPLTMELWPGDPVPEAYLALVAATHEELARLAVVAALALLVPRQLNDPMDGIIYGSIVGVGMAVEESLFYLGLGGPPPGPLLPATEPVRLMGHLVLGGITGFGVGMARMRMPRAAMVLAGCLLVSTGIHTAWDWIAFAAGRCGRMALWQTAAAIALMLCGMIFYGMLVTVGSEWSRRIFAPQQPAKLWGWPFTVLRAGASPGLVPPRPRPCYTSVDTGESKSPGQSALPDSAEHPKR
jgi:RsiW-degrading membrane proteinase PrsW (M82 family)